MRPTNHTSIFEIFRYIKESKKKELLTLMEDARQEAYEYFHDNIRTLPKNEHGEFAVTEKNRDKFYDNDVDAFRHAYASGVFTQVYNKHTANLLGWYNEYTGTNPINVQNMDLWNNSVGRGYGEKSSTRTKLGKLLKKALENGELITTTDDPREYKGLRHFDYDPKKPVEVIDESDTGLNHLFLDLSNGRIMDQREFVTAIKSGEYPGYQVVKKGSNEYPMSKPDDTQDNTWDKSNES